MSFSDFFNRKKCNLTYILHQLQKPGFFLILQRDNNTFATSNRVSLSLLRMVQEVRFKKLASPIFWSQKIGIKLFPIPYPYQRTLLFIDDPHPSGDN